ncbi:MAG: IS21 family transposase, partial [Xanthomonadales bacterium]|nr:IS21 family transposase [Xanthomonadales bacterium]
MDQREDGRSQAAAAAKAGISERTGRRIEQEGADRDRKPREWRTRDDPFEGVWDEVAEQLGQQPQLQPLTL